PVRLLRRLRAVGAPPRRLAWAAPGSAARVRRDCGPWFAAAARPAASPCAPRRAIRRTAGPAAAALRERAVAPRGASVPAGGRGGGRAGGAAGGVCAAADGGGGGACGRGAARAAGAAGGGAACPGGPPPPFAGGAAAAGIAIPAERRIRSAVMRALDCNMTP